MTERPVFPPPFTPNAVGLDVDPFDRATVMARNDVDPGTLFWSERKDIFECAVILAPENSLEESLPVLLVAMLGLGDALGALIPPVVAVTFGWPDRIEVNGGIVGEVRMFIAETANPTAIPDWLVLGFSIANQGRWAKGRDERQHRTTLTEEGCQLDQLDLLESFGRHLLAWINRWQTDGVAPIQQAWMSRATGIGKPIEIDIDGRLRKGIFRGLDEHGGIELVDEGRHQTIPLLEAVLNPA
ncbi:MAG: biotin/lipoate--protein ligase family protein [Geminicoccaceae bacterium]